MDENLDRHERICAKQFSILSAVYPVSGYLRSGVALLVTVALAGVSLLFGVSATAQFG
jgi:hypothetical protein